ncbi:hypothetical protein SprV_0702316700 [Sparganum proliferum]
MVSEVFVVINIVKQGCLLAPTLFNLMFATMLLDADRNERLGISISYTTNGQLINTRRMQVQTRLSTTIVHDLLFLDDCAPATATESDMQRSVNRFASVCANFGPTINTHGTVIMHQPSPNTEYNDPCIIISGT